MIKDLIRSGYKFKHTLKTYDALRCWNFHLTPRFKKIFFWVYHWKSYNWIFEYTWNWAQCLVTLMYGISTRKKGVWKWVNAVCKKTKLVDVAINNSWAPKFISIDWFSFSVKFPLLAWRVCIGVFEFLNIFPVENIQTEMNLNVNKLNFLIFCLTRSHTTKFPKFNLPWACFFMPCDHCRWRTSIPQLSKGACGKFCAAGERDILWIQGKRTKIPLELVCM